LLAHLNPRAISLSLVVLLLLATSALGLAFQGGGLGGLPLQISHKTTAGGSTTGTQFVLSAQREVAEFIYLGPLFFAESSHLQLPIVALKVTLTQNKPNFLPRTGRALTFVGFTNGSGEAVIDAPPGNYRVEAAGDVFDFISSVGLVGNLTTLLTLTVYPRFNQVSSMFVMNQGTLSQVEPSGTIFLNVQGTFHFLPQATYQVIGTESGSAGYASASISCKAIGEYGAPTGTNVVMVPVGAYQSLPSKGIYVMHYETNSTVAYIAHR
jgi:hypothetical protein